MDAGRRPGAAVESFSAMRGPRTARAAPSHPGILMVVVVASTAAAAVIGDRVARSGPVDIDIAALDAFDGFYDLRPAYLLVDGIARATIAIGIVFALVVLGLLATRRRFRAAAFWLVAMAGTVVLDRVLKHVVERPGIGNAADDYSFPSGNAMGVLAIVTATLLLRGRRAGRGAYAAGIVLIIGEGVALAALEWHKATHVIGGWCVALAWVAACWLVFRPGSALCDVELRLPRRASTERHDVA